MPRHIISESDKTEIRIITFEILFEPNQPQDPWFIFPSDEAGKPRKKSLSPRDQENLKMCQETPRWKKPVVRKITNRELICTCGSGLGRHTITDTQGFFLGFGCNHCEKRLLANEKPEPN